MSRKSRKKSKASLPAAAAAAPAVSSSARDLARAFGGQRLRVTTDQPGFGLFAGMQLVAPPQAETAWRDLKLDAKTLDRIGSPAELLELLCDLSPDISRALWDLLRMCNPGWECRALAPGSEEVDERAQAVLDEFLDVTLKGHYGSTDVPINRLFTNAFLRGGFFAELVLDRSGRVPVDLATPDSHHLQFRKVKDPVRGEIHEPGRWDQGEWVSYAVPTVRYVPLDPLPAKPHGRSMASPALFTVVFSLGLLHDLRRVVAQQGYPRLDVSIILEQVFAAAPAGMAMTLEERRKMVEELVAHVKAEYDALEPDDAYIHTSMVELGRPVGTVDSSSLGAIDGLMSVLERQVVRALKTMPLMFGISDGVSEANSNRQWELAAAGTKSLQHFCENLLEHLLNLVLRAQGMQASVQFRFAELRAAELMRDAQTEAINLDNAIRGYDQGLLSQDECAQKAFGKDKADQPAPRAGAAVAAEQAAQAAEAAMDVQPEPGANRAIDETLVREIVALVMARQQQQPGRNGKEEVAA